MLSKQQVSHVVFRNDVNCQVPLNWRRSNLLRLLKDGRKVFVTFDGVEVTVLKMLPVGFPWLDESISLKFSDSLYLLDRSSFLPEFRFLFNICASC